MVVVDHPEIILELCSFNPNASTQYLGKQIHLSILKKCACYKHCVSADRFLQSVSEFINMFCLCITDEILAGSRISSLQILRRFGENLLKDKKVIDFTFR